MAVQGSGLTVTFGVWDTANNEWKTGDAENLTIRVITDGTAAAANKSPVESENGQYTLELDDDEVGEFTTVEGTSSSDDCIVVPTMLTAQDAAIASRAPSSEYDTAMARIDADITSRAPAGEYDTEAARIDANISSRSSHTAADAAAAVNGTGENAVTLTVQDGDGNPVANLDVNIWNSDQTTKLARGQTDTNGQYVASLDDGDVDVLLGPNASYTYSNPYEVTVSGNTTQTLTVAASSIPGPAAASLCACYIDLRYTDGGALVDAGEGYMRLVSVNGPTDVWPDAAGIAAAAIEGTQVETDANGRASLDLVRGTQVSIEIGRAWGTGSTDKATVNFTVPDQDSYYVPLAKN